MPITLYLETDPVQRPWYEDVKRVPFDSPTFCPLPWLHTHIYPDGNVFPCCMANTMDSMGNVNDQSLESIRQGKKFQDLRQQMIEGKKPPQCRRCWDYEETAMESQRQQAVKRWQLFHDDIEQAKSRSIGIRYFDIRFSNVCNLRCRSCNPHLSTGVYREFKELYGDKAAPGKPIKLDQQCWERDLVPHLDTIERIYFAGGEPFLMPEHLDILKYLIKHKKTDVEISYSTNFSLSHYKGESIFDLWNEFDYIDCVASFDGVGKQGEFLRKGLNYEKTLELREEMIKKAPNVQFYVAATLSNMNPYSIVDLHKDLVRRQLLKVENFFINLLETPEYYRVDALPKEIKKDVLKEWSFHQEHFIRPLSVLTDSSQSYDAFEGAGDFMMKQDLYPVLKEKIKEEITQWDQIRGESFGSLFPELTSLVE
jgi:radical SAM protein with 4Fe4S-binding SPASM domain